MENIVGHYTAYSVERKCLLCTFWGGGGSSERVPGVLMDLHEPHGRHCSQVDFCFLPRGVWNVRLDVAAGVVVLCL